MAIYGIDIRKVTCFPSLPCTSPRVIVYQESSPVGMRANTITQASLLPSLMKKDERY